MDLGLKGKVALVAAASRGLGRAVAEELAAEGVSLVLCSRSAETITKAANEITHATGVDILAQATDVARPDDVARLVQSGIERFGRIDILVTNAGGPPAGQFESLSQEQWKPRPPDALQRDRTGAPRFAGNERARLGPHPEHHFNCRKAAGGKLDAVEQLARGRDRICAYAGQRSRDLRRYC